MQPFFSLIPLWIFLRSIFIIFIKKRLIQIGLQWTVNDESDKSVDVFLMTCEKKYRKVLKTPKKFNSISERIKFHFLESGIFFVAGSFSGDLLIIWLIVSALNAVKTFLLYEHISILIVLMIIMKSKQMLNMLWDFMKELTPVSLTLWRWTSCEKDAAVTKSARATWSWTTSLEPDLWTPTSSPHCPS